MYTKHKIEYFNLLDKWVAECPDKKVIIDGCGDMTYAQMDEQSARVYAWLKGHGIGRETFVMIHLPRTARILAALEGIFKAGAAYVICPMDFPPERYDFVYKDCGCAIEINESLYDEMMLCDPLPGRENPDLHDAVYAVYTSGTEGNPKGVLHEYGKLDMTWKSARCAGEPFVGKDDIYGLIAPCNFGVFNIVTVHALANGGTIFFAPSEIVKNPKLLKDAYQQAGVTVTYLPPSFLQVVDGFNTQLRKLMLCSEMSRGVYFDDIQVINAHAMSESCFETATFLIDKPYDEPPIGKPQFDNKAFIIDGEYCFENAYFRGYINKPEMTAKCLRDGIYHSGDMAYMLDNGDFVLTGRKDFMIKISGNRVEPAEVEGIIKRGLGLKHVVVRGYHDGDNQQTGRGYLCAYYTDDVIIDAREAREKLLAIAPKYMIPEYYVKMDQFPLLANGKMDHQAFRKPNVNDYRRPYAAPESDAEKQVCAAFEEVLNLNDIGLDDDFFELGGDSIRAIRLSIELSTIMGCDDVGIGSPEVYELRTPRAIAERIAKNISAKHSADQSYDGVPAEEYSQYMLDYQSENPDSTLFNCGKLIRIDIEKMYAESLHDNGMKLAQRLKLAWEKVVLAHPQLHSVFVRENNVWLIKDAPEKMPHVVIEEMSEDEFRNVKAQMLKPFVPGECVYDFRIILTEKNLYMLNEFFHGAIDGTGIQVTRRDIGRALRGEALEEDHYLKCRAELEAVKGTQKYIDDKKYLDKKFGDGKWECIPRPDHVAEGTYGVIVRGLPDDADMANVQTLAAVLNAMAKYNNEADAKCNRMADACCDKTYKSAGARDVMATWTYHNRDTKEKHDCVGLFIRDIPAGIRIKGSDSREDILRKVEEEIADGLQHMSYQWSMYGDKEILYTVNQGDFRDFEGIEGLVCDAIDLKDEYAAYGAKEQTTDDEFVTSIHEQSVINDDLLADNPVDMEFMGGNHKSFILRYNSGMYDAASAERFADLVAEWWKKSN